MSDVSFQLWFAVRYLHLASAALLLGGATIVASMCVVPRVSRGSNVVLLAAPLYEWLFWSLIAVIVATGVSNLGLKGDGLMGSMTSWATAHGARRRARPDRRADARLRRNARSLGAHLSLKGNHGDAETQSGNASHAAFGGSAARTAAGMQAPDPSRLYSRRCSGRACRPACRPMCDALESVRALRI